MTVSASSFTIVDTSGNALHFDDFRYEYARAAADDHDLNWLACTITLRAAGVSSAVDGFLLTHELRELADILESAADRSSPTPSVEFAPVERYIALRISHKESFVAILARLDLNPAAGPVIEYHFDCRPSEIKATVKQIIEVANAFPVRRP